MKRERGRRTEASLIRNSRGGENKNKTGGKNQKDARAAVARAPSSRPPLGAAASALLASSLEASGEQNSEALLEWLRCLSSDVGDLRRAEAKAAVERLRRRVPASHAAATAAAETDGGDGDGNNFARAAALSLSSLLSREAQDLLPEVMRPRPKYYHYYKWTTKRIKVRERERGREKEQIILRFKRVAKNKG